MKEYKISLDKLYSFDVYYDRYKVISTKPTIVVYLNKTDKEGVYHKAFCELVNSPKSFLHDNPPVNEALKNDAFLLLQREDKVLDEKLTIYYQSTVHRLNEYFKDNEVILIE